MVTTAKGTVNVVTAEKSESAPSPPFLVLDDQSLQLAEGAEVVLLYQGIANHLRGPRKVALTDLSSGSGSGEAKGALEDLLSKQVVTRRAAASRGGEGISLTRPVPGTDVGAPSTLRWSCDKCAEVEVSVYDFINDEVVWKKKGTAEVKYDGPKLVAGSYSVVIEGKDFPFNVPDAATLAKVEDARSAADAQAVDLAKGGFDNAAALTALPATIYLLAGMPTDALSTIEAAIDEHPDDKELKALLEAFEQKAGLRE